MAFIKARFSEASTYAALTGPLSALAISQHALGAPLWLCIAVDLVAGLSACAAVVIKG